VKLTAEAVDEDRVTTAEADPVLSLRLTNPSLAAFSAKAYGKDGKVDPAGAATGPFELTKTTGDTAATLDRFDDYWGGRAQASGIDAKFVSDSTARANALRTKDVDIAEALPVVAVARPAGWTGPAGLLPSAGCVVLLILGQLLVTPAARARVPDLAEDGRLGLYTGALSSLSGLIVLIGSSATGSLLELGLPPTVLWLVLAAVPTLAVTLLPRRPES
jgi:hypothetical protein